MKYALIIGNNSYDDPKLADLKTPKADSKAVADILSDEKMGGFDQVTPLVNQTTQKIRQEISAFLLNRKPDDLVMVYFSGHGVLDSHGRLYLATRDTQTNLLTATAIPAAFVTDELDNCRSKRQILILDCCHSGAFERGTKGDQKAVTEATFEGNGFGRVVMTASDSTQYALEGDQVIPKAELSLFTHFLFEGITSGKADMNNDGWITLDEWYDYAYTQVISLTPDQVPNKWSYRQQGDLVIARNPNFKKKEPELPLPLIQALESSIASIREGAVKELGKLLSGGDKELADLARAKLEAIQKSDDSHSVESAAGAILAKGPKVGEGTAGVPPPEPPRPAWYKVPQKRNPLLIGAGGGFVVIVAILIAIFSRPNPPPAPPANTDTSTYTAIPSTASTTYTPTFTSSLTPTEAVATPTPTFILSPTACVLRAGYNPRTIDVTIPDNTIMLPNQAFTKTWLVINLGTCTWDSSYQLVFDHKDLMGIPAGYSQPLTSEKVAPGQYVKVSVDLTAPSMPGTYTAFWRFRDANKNLFGVEGENPWIVVQIKVVNPTVTPSPTPTQTSAPPYELEYISGSGQTYHGPGMAWPMIFKIKDTATGKYITQLSELGLSLVATAPVGYQDAEFNNANNYGNLGQEGFGGYYAVPERTGVAYTLQITVTLSLNGKPIDSYSITAYVPGQ